MPLTKIQSLGITDGTIVAGDIASGAITAAKLDDLANPFGKELLHIRDEKSAGVDGGSSVTGSFNKRDLNTVLTNEISGASLASSQITLPSGTYFIFATVPTYVSGYSKSKLRNTTDSTDTLLGTSNYSGTNVSTIDFIYGRFTIAATKTFEIQQRVDVAVATYGLGLAQDYGVTESYTNAMIWKVAWNTH